MPLIKNTKGRISRRRLAIRNFAHAQALNDAENIADLELEAGEVLLSRYNQRQTNYLGIRLSDHETETLERLTEYLQAQGIQARHTGKAPLVADALRYAITLAGLLLEPIKELQSDTAKPRP